MGDLQRAEQHTIAKPGKSEQILNASRPAKHGRTNRPDVKSEEQKNEEGRNKPTGGHLVRVKAMTDLEFIVNAFARRLEKIQED
jgi:hypothetical protein